MTSGLSALPAFRDYFGVGTSGAGIGLIVAGMSIGNACASLFQFLSDIIGRRGVTFLGNAFMLLGCVLQAAAPNTACFVMGRIVQGVGASLSATCGPLYMTEIAPSCYRGMMVGAFAGMNTFGAVAIACALLGGSYLPGEWSWRMPIMLQLLPSTLVCVLIYLITPESPRYLVSKGRTEQARKILAQLHTQSESMSEAIVAAEMAQIEESLELIDNKPWDYSTFWNNRAGKRRLWIIFIYSLFQQWNGTGLLGAFVPAVLELVGISNSQQQLGYNLGLTCIGLVALVIGTTFVDRVRRRYLLLGSLALYILFFSLMIVWSGLYAYGIATYPMGIMIVVTMFLFNTATGLFGKIPSSVTNGTCSARLTLLCHAVNIVHNIYPNEVFHYKQRAKGMGLFSFFQNCFGFAMIYGGAQALAVLQWKVGLVVPNSRYHKSNNANPLRCRSTLSSLA